MGSFAGFLRALYSEWATLVAGAYSALVFVGSGVFLLLARLGVVDPSRAPIFLASLTMWGSGTIVLVWAAYRVWKREHDTALGFQEQLKACLALDFDLNDPKSVRKWPGERHSEFRVSVANVGQATVHNVDVKLLRTDPVIEDYLGLRLRVVDHPPEYSGFSLRPGDKEHVTVVDYNATASLLLIHHTVSWIRKDIPPGTYEFVLQAFGDCPPSEPMRFRFTLDGLDYRFAQCLNE